MPVRIVWNPIDKGLSVSALNLWIVNPVAFELSYFQNLEPVEAWNKITGYGNLIGAGIEGWIKTRELRGVSRFIELESNKAMQVFNEYNDIAFHTSLAEHQTRIFVKRYEKDFDSYSITAAEDYIKTPIELPSGRIIHISGRLDGSNKTSCIFEHKCKAEWDTEAIANEIDLDLQYNFYLTLFLGKTGNLPETVWYQHSRRPGGFRYRGPKKRVDELNEQYLERLKTYITENEDDHFYQFIGHPNLDRYKRFMHICMYPILERFLDWYEYMTHPNRKDQVNRHHYMTPYGLYNPYLEGTDERFRTYALTGSTLGLKKKKIYATNKPN